MCLPALLGARGGCARGRVPQPSCRPRAAPCPPVARVRPSAPLSQRPPPHLLSLRSRYSSTCSWLKDSGTEVLTCAVWWRGRVWWEVGSWPRSARSACGQARCAPGDQRPLCDGLCRILHHAASGSITQQRHHPAAAAAAAAAAGRARRTLLWLRSRWRMSRRRPMAEGRLANLLCAARSSVRRVSVVMTAGSLEISLSLWCVVVGVGWCGGGWWVVGGGWRWAGGHYAQRRGEARRGEARRGEARRGEATSWLE